VALVDFGSVLLLPLRCRETSFVVPGCTPGKKRLFPEQFCPPHHDGAPGRSLFPPISSGDLCPPTRLEPVFSPRAHHTEMQETDDVPPRPSLSSSSHRIKTLPKLSHSATHHSAACFTGSPQVPLWFRLLFFQQGGGGDRLFPHPQPLSLRSLSSLCLCSTQPDGLPPSLFSALSPGPGNLALFWANPTRARLHSPPPLRPPPVKNPFRPVQSPGIFPCREPLLLFVIPLLPGTSEFLFYFDPPGAVPWNPKGIASFSVCHLLCAHQVLISDKRPTPPFTGSFSMPHRMQP